MLRFFKSLMLLLIIKKKYNWVDPKLWFLYKKVFEIFLFEVTKYKIILIADIINITKIINNSYVNKMSTKENIQNFLN